MKKKVIIISFVVLLLGVGLLVYLGQRRAHLRELYYSGTIEAVKAELSFQISGRVTSVLVDEGQSVEKDQLLAELDPSEFQARYNQALADLDRSKKSLQRLELVLEISRNTLPVEVVRAKASVDALQSTLNELVAGYRKQDVEQAKLAFLASQVTMEEAKKDKERHDRLFRGGIISEKERDVSDLRYERTLKEYERAKEAYELLKEGFRVEAIQTAKARLSEGKAMLKEDCFSF